MTIPPIDDDTIARMLETVRPLAFDSSGVLCTMDPVDPRNMSFTWAPKGLQPLPFAVVEAQRVRTLHTFGYFGLFKPSIAEVLAQLPADLSGVVGFSIKGPADIRDVFKESDALNAGFHVAETTLWRRA